MSPIRAVQRWFAAESVSAAPRPAHDLASARALRGIRRGERPADAVRLADLPAGATARLCDAALDDESRSALRAVGLIDHALLRVCKQGEPCVVQVRTTRIGMSRRIAQHVYVIPADAREPAAIACP